MTALDKRFRKLATLKIAKYGASVTFRSVTSGQYDPLTGSSNNTITDIDTKALVEGFEPDEIVGLILASDKKFSIAAAGIPKPKPGDKIILEEIAYVIQKDGVKEVWSGEQICLFEVQGRA